MSSGRIAMRDIAKEWLKDPEFRAEYEALEPEFALASALIEARSRAGMTQAQVAEAMGTTQAVIARLEGGRIKPSTRTLERFAKATGTRLASAWSQMQMNPCRRVIEERHALPNNVGAGRRSGPPEAPGRIDPTVRMGASVEWCWRRAEKRLQFCIVGVSPEAVAPQ